MHPLPTTPATADGRRPTRAGRRAIVAATVAAALAGISPIDITAAAAATGNATIRIDQRGPAGEAVRGGCWLPTDLLTGESSVELCDVDDGAIDGVVTFAGLAGGDYSFHQTFGPDTYRPAADVTVTVADDAVRTAVTHHVPFPRVVVTTTVQGAARAGSCFLLLPPGQVEGGDRFCDDADGADGVARLPVGAAGTYDLVHVVAPGGFALASTRTVSIDDTDVAVTVELTAATTPVNVTPPSIAGAPEVGRTVTGNPGTWTPAGVTTTGSWLRCDAAGGACTEIVNDTDRYTITTADLGTTLRYRVTATAGIESTVVQSAPVAVAALAKPVALTQPAISGTPRAGYDLTVAGDTWTGAPAVSVRWQRCDDAGTCTDIANATARTYRTGVADADRRIRAVLVAANAAGTTSVATATTEPIDDTIRNTTAPSIVGDPREGASLTAQSGMWVSLYGNIQFGFRWQRCTAAGCTDLAATSSTYRVTAADVGARLQVQVTATDRSGSVTVTSALTPTIVAAGPWNVVEPQVVGSTNIGDTLDAYPGMWSSSGRLRLVFQWQRCSTVGSNLVCTDIARATGRSYEVTKADDTYALRVVVSATDNTGTAVRASAPSATVVARRPVMVAAPSLVAANPIVGTKVTAQRGTWYSLIGDVDYRYTWMRCTDPTPTRCTSIPGADKLQYTVMKDDVGHWLRMRVDARNADGTSSAVTELTSEVVLTRPVNLSLPTITGTPRVGTKLVGSQGTWFSADGTLDFQYQWVRMDPAANRGDWIAGATGRNYTPTRADAGYRLRLLVIVRNHSGETSRASEITTAVIGR